MEDVQIKKNKQKFISILRWFFSIEAATIAILIGILVGVASFYIQDKIQRQRYLELLQLELRKNEFTAVNTINEYKKYGFLYASHTPYQTSVYQSGLQLGYILTIDPKILPELYTIYSTVIPFVNNDDSQQINIINDYVKQWQKCIVDHTVSNSKIPFDPDCKNAETSEKNAQKIFSEYISKDAQFLEKNLNDVNTKFNPTADRLKSPILRILMGTQRLKMQE